MNRRIWNLLPIALLAGTAASTSARGQDAAPKMVILDRNLARIPGDFERLTPTSVHYTDGAGRSRSIERAKVLAIYTPGSRNVPAIPSPSLTTADAAAEAPGILRLTDGQVIPGFLQAGGTKGESFAWRNTRTGTFELPLERAEFVQFAELTHRPPRPQRDTALLTNNDRVDGFLERLGSDLVIEVDKASQTIPVSRVMWVAFANPPALKTQPLVALTDGCVLAAAELGPVQPAGPKPTPSAAMPSGVTVKWALGDAPALVIDVGSLDAVIFDPPAIVPLSSLAPPTVKGLDDRRWTPAPDIGDQGSSPVGLASITLAGPAQFDWKLPSNAAKFGTTLALPPGAVSWGNASVTVLVGGAGGQFREVGKADLSSDKPSQDLVVDVSGVQTLRIEVRGKAYGDVQAKVGLLQPMLTRAEKRP
ncbi:MAG: hypothetical protein JSS51_13985 [Planctomycetes bacterium]|nr:hypothetical protein [Planctomycetota bacterium]